MNILIPFMNITDEYDRIQFLDLDSNCYRIAGLISPFVPQSK